MSTNASEAAANRIASFIVSDLGYTGTVADLLGPNPVRLTEAIDSAGLMELASYVEDDFGAQIQDDDLVPENFATVRDLVRMLGDKGALGELPGAHEEDPTQDQP